MQTFRALGFVLLWGSTLSEPIAGPFDIIVERIEVCPPAMLDYAFNYTVRTVRDRKHLSKWFYSINVTTATDLSDRHDLHVILASWSSRGGWTDNAQVVKMRRGCSSLKTYAPLMYRTTMNATFGSPDRDCPIPAGTYRIVNWPLNLDMKFPYFYGKWRAICKAVESGTGKCPACIRAYVQTVPKPRH